MHTILTQHFHGLRAFFKAVYSLLIQPVVLLLSLTTHNSQHESFRLMLCLDCERTQSYSTTVASYT